MPLGLSIALSIAVGQLLGAGKVVEARRVVALALGLGCSIIGALCAGVYLARYGIISLYTSDDVVFAQSEAIWPWLCLDILVDNAFGLLSGVNRGLGLQRRSAACIVFVLWPLGLPMIGLAADSVLHVWQLMPILYLVLDAAQVACFMCANWHTLAQRMQQEEALTAGTVSSSSSSCTSSSSSARTRSGPSSKQSHSVDALPQAQMECMSSAVA